MTSFAKASIFSAAIAVAGVVGFAPAAPAQDNVQILKDRQALMKQQAKDLGSIKAYLTGKADQAAAQTAAADLTHTMQKIPSLFPPGSGASSPDGKYAPKPAIWADWDKFLAARNTAAAKADTLVAAMKSGSNADVQAAFADLGKHGCGGCHENFRQTIKN
jgi:cytochrome c556